MKNKEVLLTNIPKIMEYKFAGFKHAEIAQEINQSLGLDINEITIRNVLSYLKNNKINKKYNTFALINLNVDVGGLIDFSIVAHDLIITTPAIVSYFELNHHQLTPNNFKKKVSTEKGMLYAKRLLKQYWVSDKELIEYLRLCNPSTEKINYDAFINELHSSINDQVNSWILELKAITKKYLEMKGRI